MAKRRRGTWGETISNWQVDMPLSRKLYLAGKNLSRRATIKGGKLVLRDCCGNHGEPGC